MQKQSSLKTLHCKASLVGPSTQGVQEQIANAARILRQGGVVAYPTEHCYGLGCDPLNEQAVSRIASLKKRSLSQGVLLIAASVEQVELFAELTASPQLANILDSWPGPNTWTLAARANVSDWITGQHSSVAIRVSAHPVCRELCIAANTALVSTSANRHGQAALQNWESVEAEFSHDLDFVVRAEVGGLGKPSRIRSGSTGEVLR